MAFTTIAVVFNASLIGRFNVDFAVGSGALNHQDDVMLVQALMRIFYWELGADLNGGNAPPAGDTKPIEVDGFAGPSTRRHIIKWQQDLIRSEINVTLDGRLDPFRKQSQVSTISKTRYALEILNNVCHNNCRENGVSNYSSLPNREDVPATLRAALKTVKTTAAAYETSFA